MKMDNEIQVEAFPKRVWSVMRVLFFMLKKGISKRKALLHLNLVHRRSGIAGKSIENLMFRHQSATNVTTNFYKAESEHKEYEFSCSNTPAHYKLLFKRKQPKAQYEPIEAEYISYITLMGLNDVVVEPFSSPVLPGLLGFGKVRIMDSPNPNQVLSDRVDEGDCHVDEAAEEFIMKFYDQLKRQTVIDG